MKQQKLEGHNDLNAKKAWKNSPFKILKNSSGVSLIELMVTVSIGAIVSMGIASVFVFAMQQFTILVEKNTAEENALQVTYYLRDYLAQAVDLNAVSVINTGAFAGGTGQINVKFDSLDPLLATDITDPDNGQFARFAIFNREAGRYNVNSNTLPTGGSDIRPTGIFVKDTDVDGVNPDAQSGAVVFDFNTTPGNALIPQASDLNYSRIHRFRVQRINCNGDANGFAVELVNFVDGNVLNCIGGGWAPGGNTFKVKTITLEIWTRYFKSSTKGDWNYRAPIGGGATAPYRDIVQTVKINFKNNVLTRNSKTGAAGADERVHGSLYFYDYVMPGTRAN